MKDEKQKVKEKIDGFLTGFSNKLVYGWKPEMDKEYISDNTPKDIKKSFLEMTRVPLWCPKCKHVMNKPLDTKMYWLHNMCMDCVAIMETQLRIEGKWEEYQRNKIKENIRSYIKDTEQQVEEQKRNLRSETTVVNVANEDLASIDYEKWKMNNTEIEDYGNKLDNILKEMHEDFEKTFGEKVHLE